MPRKVFSLKMKEVFPRRLTPRHNPIESHFKTTYTFSEFIFQKKDSRSQANENAWVVLKTL